MRSGRIIERDFCTVVLMRTGTETLARTVPKTLTLVPKSYCTVALMRSRASEAVYWCKKSPIPMAPETQPPMLSPTDYKKATSKG